MKRLSQLLIMASFCVSMSALGQNQVTLRQQNFPTALPVEDDNIEWMRDIYREINLSENENAGLYCPLEPTENQRGLFTKLFSLAVAKMIPIYRYNIDGNEVFNNANRADIKDILINHHIFYQEEDGHILIDKSDVPATDVMTYYIKEGVYYDMTNSAFRIRVLALCPVLESDDDLTGGLTKYPLFWVEYKDLEPYLKDVTIIPDYRNRATVMMMTDYFTRNLYKGDIYKISNPMGKTLRQMVDSDSALAVEQQRIEKELREVRKTTYNTYYNPTAVEKRTETPARKPKRKIFPWQKKEALKDDSEQ